MRRKRKAMGKGGHGICGKNVMNYLIVGYISDFYTDICLLTSRCGKQLMHNRLRENNGKGNVVESSIYDYVKYNT